MPPLHSYTRGLTEDQANRLRDVLEARDFEFKEKPYTLYAAQKGKLSVAVYEKGPKVLVQGKETEEFVQFTLEPEILGAAELGYEEEMNPEMFAPHFGIDESGKGDFFGPMVIAGAFTNAGIARSLIDDGIQDSKRITSDARIAKLAKIIRETPGMTCEVLCLGPSRYNALYAKFRNVNRLLAWSHAMVIEALAARVPDCPRALSDQFANPRELERALKSRKVEIELQQRTKAESDVAVAAASILARDRFVTWMTACGEKAGTEIPRGASARVKDAARAIVEKHGEPALAGIAKMHFKTATEVLGHPPNLT